MVLAKGHKRQLFFWSSRDAGRQRFKNSKPKSQGHGVYVSTYRLVVDLHSFFYGKPCEEICI